MEDLFTKPVSLPQTKKSFYQKSSPSPIPKKLENSQINLSI